MKYNYPQLKEPCKSCLGCQRLEDINFIVDKNCKYAKEIMKNILGEQQKI